MMYQHAYTSWWHLHLQCWYGGWVLSGDIKYEAFSRFGMGGSACLTVHKTAGRHLAKLLFDLGTPGLFWVHVTCKQGARYEAPA